MPGDGLRFVYPRLDKERSKGKTMSESQDPIVLELAPLPREKIGAFILLGVEKDADSETIEAHWAQRVIWARKNQIDIALTEVNWAREVLNDPDKRVRADVTSLNTDITSGVLQDLAQRYGVGPAGPAWKPLEGERTARESQSPIEIPDPEEVRNTISVPEPPSDLPGVKWMLDQFLAEPIHPWDLKIPNNE
jgi:hypothetical protein